jgi:hypothetical protein
VQDACVNDWLDEALASFSLTEDAEGYLLGRGVKESRIRDLGLVLWDSSRLPTEAPDPAFRDSKTGHGPRGERLDGKLCTSLRSPRGRLLGFEARAWRGEKRVTQYLLPEAAWNPVLVGLTPTTMRRLWDGADVWVGEGLFDMSAMEHVIPARDVAFATLRARVSDHHAAFFRRFCRGWVNMVYDNDETGRRQTHGYTDAATNKHRWGALEILSRVGVRARDVPYRGGKDPGEIWDRGGAAGLRRAFAEHLIAGAHQT